MELPAIPSFYHFRDEDFSSISNEIFLYQMNGNKIYKDFIHRSNFTIFEHFHPSNFPFLPIGFFKTHKVYGGEDLPDVYFESSGTGRQQVSKHYMADLAVYESCFSAAF